MSDSEQQWPLGLDVPDAAFVVACAACGVRPEASLKTVSGLKIDRSQQRDVARRMADVEYLLSLGDEPRALVSGLALWLKHGNGEVEFYLDIEEWAGALSACGACDDEEGAWEIEFEALSLSMRFNNVWLPPPGWRAEVGE